MKLQEGEKIIHELYPEPSILGIWFFTKCLGIAILGGFLSLWFFGFFGAVFSSSSGSGSSCPFVAGGIAAIIVSPILLVLGLIYCIYLRRTYVYYVTDQRCIFHGGILRRVERSVPYHKVTDVETSQNIIERMLGISSLNIFTPGTGSMYSGYPFGGQRAEIRFVGLRDSETPATTINEILRKFRATGE